MYTFFKRINGRIASITLHSLKEYEDDGGRYDDSGNGGEAVDKAEFLCAATVSPGESGLPENDILEECGMERGEYWYDSVTGYFLLRDWPADAPLEARCSVG